MSGFTKEIIIRTLFELLNEKPLAKITVKDIVERCGVNRNTFYYHFRDISDVVESALLREVDNAFEHPVEVDSMLECLEVLVKLIGENKKAMLHIYCSVQRETFTSALDKMCQYVIKQYIVHNFKEEIMEKEDMKVLMHFYKCVMIGVILDWVPAHFPKDAHGLADFDGQPLYEYADPRKGEHPEWGTKIFDYGKNEVKNFMLANALYWVEEYHVDGLRVDAVASMLYLDYGKEPGQWVPNKNGGNENLEAVEFFKHLNTLVRGRNKGVIMIAEESTTWPKVTGSVEDGGLHFSYKWNMGWMHDFLDYMKLDPYFRKYNHNKMTFGMTYAFSENYILVLSHDEVVHLKCSMINKMPGDLKEKFQNLMVGYAFMFGHPGKKLLFMGQDFGQLREWSEEREIDWFLLADEGHQHLQTFFSDLLKMYRKYPALYANDCGYEGFQWINANDGDRSIYSFVRWSPTGKNNLLFVCNFTPVERPDYMCGVPRKKQYRLILDSSDMKYGGPTEKRQMVYRAKDGECDGQPYRIAYSLPAYGVAVFSF